MKELLIALAAMAADFITKKRIKMILPVNGEKHIKGRLWLKHVKNKGLAYNKLEDRRKAVTIISSATLAAVAGYIVYLIRSGARMSEKIGPVLLFGGGMGNLADRIMNKEVTDFIYIKADGAPIFNIADVTTLIGAVLTVINSFKADKV